MTLKMAFAGFRHGHILGLYRGAVSRDDVEVVAAADEHRPTRQKLAADKTVAFTHDSYERMLSDVDFDVLAVGEYYGGRGELAIRALESGRHVLADKPLCTRMGELERIAELAEDAGLSVGCMLTMRESGNFVALRQLIEAGRIGQVHTIDFQGQHPLLRGSRPGWYFQPDGQGGTINDIAIHAMDAIPWMTGRRIVEVVAARAWNARLADPDWFQDGAQMMLRLDNGGGVLGDVSYLTPDSHAYKVGVYWRYTLHGGEGVAETSSTAKGVTVSVNGGKLNEHVPPAPGRDGAHLADFLAEIRGEPTPPEALTTRQVLAASRRALLAQKAADEGLFGVACE
ncbi:MAG TPA: Gfo/Idh/MocA family oxidoreductase [Phycisphaerae bacterium]|nr:Gfo/Idh/MocA family oxidoreductase [Phycisphaerae bacterium]